MAEYNNGRYYWIKLTDRFLESDTVDYLMSQKDGSNYVVLYQMLCLKTVNQNGVLARKLGEIIIPYDEEKIVRDCKYFSIDTVRIALTLYKNLGLIYEQENGVLRIANFERLIGSQTISAEKKQIQRQGNKQLPLEIESGQRGGQEVDICPPDIEKDKEIDINNIHTARAYASEEKLTSFELNLNAFCKRWSVTVDNYSPLIAELDFEKLNKAYSESTKFLQVVPVARTISWVIKNAVSIYAGKYKDKKDESGENKQTKGHWDEMLENIGRIDKKGN